MIDTTSKKVPQKKAPQKKAPQKKPKVVEEEVKWDDDVSLSASQ